MSKLEERFYLLWLALGGPSLEHEFRFSPPRRWKADFCCHEARLLIEIEGGVYTHGRHTSIKGFLNDAEKYLEAELLGYTVMRLTDKQLTPETMKRIIAYAGARISQ